MQRLLRTAECGAQLSITHIAALLFLCRLQQILCLASVGRGTACMASQALVLDLHLQSVDNHLNLTPTLFD